MNDFAVDRPDEPAPEQAPSPLPGPDADLMVDDLTAALTEHSGGAGGRPVGDAGARIDRITAQLVAIRGRVDGIAELQRFADMRRREIDLDDDAVGHLHSGRTVLVTGGTGCIGSALLGLLAGYGAARLVSISRGVTTSWPRIPGVEYLAVDVRDRDALLRCLAELKPDVVYHLAAQHDPGLAEVESARTISTNVGGVRNVIEACRGLPGVRLVFASTGKAMRPFSADVYAATKKIAEHLLAEAAIESGVDVCAVRFTHVVDNSIIHRRLLDWTSRGEPIRLHDVRTMFYLQSAREAAQLLLSAVIDAVPRRWAISAIRDLGWPASLLDLALGTLARTGSSSPILVCGAQAGYESEAYPALYDPGRSGAHSPLFSALEVGNVRRSRGAGDVDVYDTARHADIGTTELIRELVAAVGADVPAQQCASLLSAGTWSVLASRLRTVEDTEITKHVAVLRRLPDHLFVGDHRGVREAVLAEFEHRQRSLTSSFARVSEPGHRPVLPRQHHLGELPASA